MSTEPFDFPGESGQTLSGRLDLPEEPASAFVLFAHCFTCTKSSLAAAHLARSLTRLGFGVLRFDFTGLGQSGGDFADSTFSGSVRDIVAAAAAMRAAGRAPSLLIGHSLGGAAVLAAAGDVLEARAVATIAAPFDVAHAERLFSNLDELMTQGEAEVQIGGRPFRIRRSFIEDLRAHDQAERIRQLRKPLLIMHAPEDSTVGIENAGAIFQAARHPKSFVSLAGADHLLTRKEDADFVAAIVSAWARRYLPGTPPRTAAQSGLVTVTETGEGDFQMEVSAGGVSFLADEPPEVGGLGSGPTPYDLLAAGLGACTAMTVRLYARHKKLPLERVSVEVGHSRRADTQPADLFVRRLHLQGSLSDDDRQKLTEIAEKCPVHRTLHAGAAIETVEGDSAAEVRVERPGTDAQGRAKIVGTS
ncbi:bifunctional alpha/beta hydrolase/OsmC family protein [Novosphingobium album (ex Liu et al. 2023)]|uniref:Bifunctional alpha/beta hydrolase/OsmC family protein n=1 Tax=Novosphingobium album (ex Liu et al. 2023) TaxID=3031130 RepID=A0ABT5WS40_9SPHN|nr:bifunctional alpha/beta hydrolase/OsmC family protein [Novosphingobium album (ex Liu et al. 2023)]MDE8652815.1 bifunctional alpha/beta hydrolase/OsmC family protein [Novosphingobium album (ex Liu et al. 2023)]